MCICRTKKLLIIDNVAPATRLLEKRRQMIEVGGIEVVRTNSATISTLTIQVQEALAAQKEEFARREVCSMVSFPILGAQDQMSTFRKHSGGERSLCEERTLTFKRPSSISIKLSP
jgi:hypothetical protein